MNEKVREGERESLKFNGKETVSPKTHSYIHDGRDHTKPNLSE